KEFRNYIGSSRLGSQSHTKQYLEASGVLTVQVLYFWNTAQIMPIVQGRIFITGRKGYFKLPSHLLVDGISQKVFKGGISIGCYIKGFVGIYTCRFRSCNISDRITACFTNGNIVLI